MRKDLSSHEAFLLQGQLVQRPGDQLLHTKVAQVWVQCDPSQRMKLGSFSDVFFPNWCDSHCILYPVILLIVFCCGVGAMRVAAESRRSFREAVEVAGLNCTFGDATLDSVMRHVRQTVNQKKPSGWMKSRAGSSFSRFGGSSLSC